MAIASVLTNPYRLSQTLASQRHNTVSFTATIIQFKYMAKKDLLIIDLTKWCTQAEYARITGTKLPTVSQWVKRAIAGYGVQKIDYMEIPALGLTLVARPQ
jgi:hypothetical protein